MKTTSHYEMVWQEYANSKDYYEAFSQIMRFYPFSSSEIEGIIKNIFNAGYRQRMKDNFNDLYNSIK